jgi:hypothetical protein
MHDYSRRNAPPAASEHWRVLRDGRVRRRRRRVWAFVLPILAVLLAFWLIDPWLNGWTRQPVEARERAVQALGEARDANADRWAPDSLRLAEAALRTGMSAERVQAARLFFWRDFRRVEDHYLSAAELARRAAIASVLQRDDARFSASSVIAHAERVIKGAETAAGEMPFPRKERMLLQHARTLAEEAAVLFASTEYPQAGELAQRAAVEAEQACRGVLPLAERFINRHQLDLWRRWIDETVGWSRDHRNSAVIVYKEKNLVQLYHCGRPVRSYAADMGRNSLYAKQHAGDAATPEGRYKVVSKKDRGNSKYHKALLLDYPNAEDRTRFREAQRRGEIPRYAHLGGLIEIHGEGGRGQDWTLGCVALSNADMNDLFSRVEVGLPVTIVGGDGRDGTFSNLARSLMTRDFSQGK